MSQSLIESMATEILSRIFRLISDDERDEGQGQVSIKSLRLVSKRFMEISSDFLVRSANVYLASQSFSRLEELCRHPHFHKSINTVIIETSYYDLNLARDPSDFVKDCASRLSQTLEIVERSLSCSRRLSEDGDLDEEYQRLLELRVSKTDAAGAIEEELIDFANNGWWLNWNHDTMKDSQRTLIDMHREYVMRTNDQEALRIDNDHIKRLCACLVQLPALKRIDLTSGRRSPPSGPWSYLRDDSINTLPPPKSFYSFALQTSGWNGTFHTAYTTKPPTEMLGELLSQLGEANLRPHDLHIRLDVPADLECLRVNEEQSRGIRLLVSRAATVNLCFDSWARKSSYAENNDRSLSEMAALGSITKALTSTPSLKTLKVKLDHYPVFYEFPTANMSDLLPIQSIVWPNLEYLEFTHAPFDLDDLQVIVDRHKNTLECFIAGEMYLRDSQWKRVLDTLRGCVGLKRVEIRYPRGGEYPTRAHPRGPDFPRGKAEDYVLSCSDLNPLV